MQPSVQARLAAVQLRCLKIRFLHEQMYEKLDVLDRYMQRTLYALSSILFIVNVIGAAYYSDSRSNWINIMSFVLSTVLGALLKYRENVQYQVRMEKHRRVIAYAEKINNNAQDQEPDANLVRSIDLEYNLLRELHEQLEIYPSIEDRWQSKANELNIISIDLFTEAIALEQTIRKSEELIVDPLNAYEMERLQNVMND